ncbi:major allergen I polypeptide chain 2-like [Mustela nigripes]|uniref:major allergen I polypeptide chain 2-like n=1 Tax=Mustela nigripes TaxID=77151 RepID=UPI0028160B76|nr:major allergen I polypeptide chain 2-like [Mustela nigripes]
MKGTLLMLALLVTQELGIEMGETCPIFYSTFGALAIGERFPLDLNLDVVGATEPEKEALEKIQDCYNEKGLEAKGLDLIVMTTITTSNQCFSEGLGPTEGCQSVRGLAGGPGTWPRRVTHVVIKSVGTRFGPNQEWV